MQGVFKANGPPGSSTSISCICAQFITRYVPSTSDLPPNDPARNAAIRRRACIYPSQSGANRRLHTECTSARLAACHRILQSPVLVPSLRR